MKKAILLLAFIPFFLIQNGIFASEKTLSEEELEKWFEDDSRLHPIEDEVNEGALVFLTKIPEKRTPHSRNLLSISESSLDNGWVKIEQCHENLDPVHAVEVVYRYKQMRALQVIESTNIAKAWVEGNSVQLEDVQKNARLCVQAEANILYDQKDGTYILRNGPFERKFLDGYFPMHVSLLAQFPHGKLKYVRTIPEATTGFVVRTNEESVLIDTWFEGKLMLEVIFRLVI